MSSFAWMKVLESTAGRYDRGIRMLSGGRIDAVYRRIAEIATADAAGATRSGHGPSGAGARVLDIGCGTGGVALACVALGADVVGIDRNAAMLEMACEKALPANSGRVVWLELGAMEIEDRFAPASFDTVVSCLAFSEMASEEQAYVLEVARTRLAPGGRLVVADEVAPRSAWRRAWHAVRRWPVALLAFLLTQATTRPVEGLPARVRAAGFVDVEQERLWGDAFFILRARAPGGSERVGAGARGGLPGVSA
jgi:demethylmenaquinone methyltransferase/2-methoxy-6-polyprenyl-1,4-benzoquinol methylase